jgi:hypothetical protein
MKNEANPEADKAAWTIKSVPVETRKLAVACATKAGLTMAEWLTLAVRDRANREAGNRVLPPLAAPGAGRALAPLAAPAGPLVPTIDMAGLTGLLGTVQAMATAADVPVPRATARHGLALATAQLRAARGLSEKAPRQTRPKSGQTINGALVHGYTGGCRIRAADRKWL